MSDRDAFREAREHGLAKRHEQRLEHATYTAAEVKVLTETALRLGRQEAADELAAVFGRRAQLAERVPEGERSGVREGMVVTWIAAQRLAEDIAALPFQAASDATSGVPRHSEVPEAPKAPQEPTEPAADLVGALRASVAAARERRLAEQDATKGDG